MLELMEKVLPIGGDEWQEVEDGVKAKFPPGRDQQSLKRKYNQLQRRKHPTGDPNIPPEIQLAKTVHRKIGMKAMLGNGEEPFDLTNGFPATAMDEPTQQQPTQLLLGQPTQLTQETAQLTQTQQTQQTITQQTQESVPVARRPPRRKAPPRGT